MDKNTDHENNYMTRFFKSPFFIAAYTLIAVFCALLLQWSVEFIDPKYLVYGLAASLGVMTVIIATTVLINKMKNQEALDDKITHLNQIIMNNNMNWMVNQRHLRMTELQSEETWTFAPELTFAIQPDSVIFDGIKRNLSKGARYKFFMPDRPRVHKIVADYKRLHKFEPGQVEFILIPHSEFIFHTLISVYNIGTNRPRAIEWIPVRELNVWVEMDEEHSNRMVGIGEILLRKYADRYVSRKEKEETPQQAAVIVNDS